MVSLQDEEVLCN